MLYQLVVLDNMVEHNCCNMDYTLGHIVQLVVLDNIGVDCSNIGYCLDNILDDDCGGCDDHSDHRYPQQRKN